MLSEKLKNWKLYKSDAGLQLHPKKTVDNIVKGKADKYNLFNNQFYFN